MHSIKSTVNLSQDQFRGRKENASLILLAFKDSLGREKHVAAVNSIAENTKAIKLT